jgi:hypothetical protein
VRNTHPIFLSNFTNDYFDFDFEVNDETFADPRIGDLDKKYLM